MSKRHVPSCGVAAPQHQRDRSKFESPMTALRRVVALASAAARLMRAFAGHVETLRRLRHGGDQYVRVEHVHINDGGQAVIGNVKPAQSGESASSEPAA